MKCKVIQLLIIQRKRNSFRNTPYHRLDLSPTLTPRKNDKRKWKSNWVFSVYNVYNRQNAFYYFLPS
ncbi:MAG: hypothetical protein IPG89_02970 [Bacteroidetes bacterium]|nr:hypothetical protein [Bacteroidota bacterium]